MFAQLLKHLRRCCYRRPVPPAVRVLGDPIAGLVVGLLSPRAGGRSRESLFSLRHGALLLAFRKHQGWWQALESRLRGELRSSGLERVLWARQRKER